MKLEWVGKPGVLGVEGWPAADHTEPDKKVADAKVKSGLYRKAPERKAKARPKAKAPEQTATNSKEG